MEPAVVPVVSVATPLVNWRCPRCDALSRFRCSERFRTNGNGKLTDIWLIYRCERCATTKNLTVVERTPIARIDDELFRAATENDGAVARRISRDVGLIRRAGGRIGSGDEWVFGAVVPPRP